MGILLGLKLLLVTLLVTLSSFTATQSASDLVNVLAGTINDDSISTGGNMPLIARPFGFNHWSVVTTLRDDRFAFSPASTQFYGILCTHQPSWWIGDYGYFVILPTMDVPLTSFIRTPGMSLFRPDQAEYKPYYFRASSVSGPNLAQYGYVVTEMTPTNHAAALRFRFVCAGNKHVTLRNDKGLTLLSDSNDASKIVLAIEANSGGVPEGFRMFVVVDTKPRPKSIWHSTMSQADIILDFDPSENTTTAVIEMRVATSFISVEQAWRNLDREAPWNRTFDFIKEDGRRVWDERMTAVHIDHTVNDQTFLRTFYTNYYRSLLFPRLLTEVDGSNAKVHYSPYTGQVHAGELAADSGFWDSYNTVYLWLDFAAPDILARLLEGWVNAYKEAGWLPTWPSPGQRDSMIGTMGDVVGFRR